MRASALLISLLMATTLAGCLDPSTDEDLDSADVAPDDLPVPVGDAAIELLAAVDLGKAAGEPNIAVGPDGTVYVADPSISVWRSDDGGKSYTKTGAAGIQGGGDGDIAVDGTGRLHWLGLFGDAGPIPYQYSDDRGETFSEALDVSDDTGSDREWLDALPDGTLYTSWRGEGGIDTRTSLDGGETWLDVVTMAPDAIGGPIVAGVAPGSVYEAMTTFESSTGAGDAGVFLARSRDHAQTWETVPVYTPPQGAQFGLIGFPTSIFPVVAVDDAGTLYVVFSADAQAMPTTLPKPAARFGVYLTTSGDDGDSWSEPSLISDGAKASLMPFVDAGAPGRIAVVWYENQNGVPSETVPDVYDVRLWVSTDGGETGESRLINTEPAHVGSVCTSGTGCLASDRSLLDFMEVVITPDGRPLATWSTSVVGTGVGIAAQGTNVWAGGFADGPRLR